MALRIILDVLMALGLFFAFAGTRGILKMPDTFCRMQASTCVATLGVIGFTLAGVLYSALILHNASFAVKIGIVALLIIVTNPIGGHAIAKGAYKAGIRPEKDMVVDDYGRDFNE